ncbi:MAG: hypothetical protein N2654_01865 [Deltaproteobacteria bacterium]|nr:hypothetical protein [Deltaproteobacteria bacterium]
MKIDNCFFVSLCLFFFVGCSVRERSLAVEHTAFTALSSGGIGAGAGAVIGNQIGKTGEAALVGSAAGVLSGVVLGAQLDTLAYRIERAEEEIKLVDEQLRRVRASIKDELFKGDDEIFSVEPVDVEISFDDTLRLTNDHKQVIKLFSSLVKTYTFPFQVNVKIIHVPRKDVLLHQVKPEELAKNIVQEFQANKIDPSLVDYKIETHSEGDNTKAFIGVTKIFKTSPAE